MVRRKTPIGGQNRVRPVIWQFVAQVVAASARRARLSSRPSTAMTSKIGGEAVLPVSAARKGCAAWPNFSPCASAKARTAASSDAASQAVLSSACAKRRSAAWRARAAPSPCRRSGSAAARRRNAQSRRARRGSWRAASEPGIAAASRWRSLSVSGRDSVRSMKGAARATRLLVVGLADVMAVEIGELGEIETRRRAADAHRGRTIRSPARSR